MKEPENRFSRAKSQDIVSLASSFGINAKLYSKHCCVFKDHLEDKIPSLQFYPEQNSFYCFGCKKGGSNIDFVIAARGGTVGGALKYIERWFKLPNIPPFKSARKTFLKKDRLGEDFHIVFEFEKTLMSYYRSISRNAEKGGYIKELWKELDYIYKEIDRWERQKESIKLFQDIFPSLYEYFQRKYLFFSIGEL